MTLISPFQPTEEEAVEWKQCSLVFLHPLVYSSPWGEKALNLTGGWGEGPRPTRHLRSSKEKLPLALDPPALSWDQGG